MDGPTRRFTTLMSGVHGVDHLLKRLFPPLVPVWAAAFGFPLWKLGVLLGAHSLGTALGQTPLGILADRRDRRGLLAGGVGLIGVSLCLFGALPLVGTTDVSVAVAGVTFGGRFLLMLGTLFVAGLGSSVVHPAGYPLISTNVPAKMRGRALGMWGSAAKFGDGLAPAVVGVFLVVVAWNWIVVALGLVAVAYAAVVYLSLAPYETRPAAVADGSGADGSAVDADGPDADDADANATDADGATHAYRVAMFAVFAYFVVQLAAAAGVTAFLPQFVTEVYGYTLSLPFGVHLASESTASLYFSALLLVAGVTQLGTGRLVDRADPRWVLVGHLTVASVLLFAVAVADLSAVALFAVLLVLGPALWGVGPARDALVTDIAPADREGRTFGYLWTGAMLAGAAAPALVGYVGDVTGLRLAFAVLAVVTLLSVLPVVLLVRYDADGGATAASADG